MFTTSLLSTVPLAGPALLLAAGLLPLTSDLKTPQTLRRSRIASLGALGAAPITVLLVVFLPGHRLEWQPVSGFGILLDPVSVTMYTLVAFVGAIVIQYSRNYLDGDTRQWYFMQSLCLVLAAVLLLTISGNLVLLVMSWIATSLLLHRLLVFYPDRPAAQLAAWKKFVTARASDAALITASLCLYLHYGTLDIASILDAARTQGASVLPVAAAFLLALAAILKSAQFPFHGWLPEVMETPTPVSALLHAGIINAGGFLLIRFADAMTLSPMALAIVALIGLVTAIVGSLSMLTQTSVKVSLAWSTVAQMGFMLLQCGLGAFSAALVHLVAHSLYKAHAFLSSGSIVEVARANAIAAPMPHGDALISPARQTGAIAFLATGFAVAALAFSELRGELILIFVLGAAVMQMTLSALATLPPGASRNSLLVQSAALGLAYFAIQGMAAWLLSPTLPTTPTVPAIVALIVITGFALSWWVQNAARQTPAPAWLGRLYAPLLNGFYANAIFNRLAATSRLAPAVLKRS